MKHKRFSLGTRIRIIKKKLKQVWLYPHRPHTQQLRHASYKLLKTIAVNVVSSDQGGQGSFLAKNLNDLTALKTNLFQLFVCILQAWGNEGEALNYVKLWKERKKKKKQTFHATKLFKLASHLYSGIQKNVISHMCWGFPYIIFPRSVPWCLSPITPQPLRIVRGLYIWLLFSILCMN